MRVRIAVIVAALASAGGGCGGSGGHERVPATPQAARSPAVGPPPAGRVIRVGAAAEGVVVDPRTGIVAVGVRHPDGVELLDVRTGALLRRVAVPAPRHLTLAAPGGPVLDAAEHADRLIEIGLPEGRVLARVRTAPFPHDAVSAGGLTFVADQLGGTVDVLAGDAPIRRLSGLVAPTGVAVSGGRLAVIDGAAHQLVVFALDTGQELARLPAGIAPTHAVADADGRVYVLDSGTGQILGFSLLDQPAMEVATAVGGRPFGLAIDRARQRLWIVDPATDRLIGLRLSGVSPRPFVTLPTVRQPNSVAVDEATGRVVVVGRAAGQLELVDPRPG